jgi:hypothetical protein
VGLEVGLHVVPAAHLLAAEQADELGLPVGAQHCLGTGLKGGDRPCNVTDSLQMACLVLIHQLYVIVAISSCN